MNQHLLSQSEINLVKHGISTCLTKLLYIAPESLSKEYNINFLKRKVRQEIRGVK